MSKFISISGKIRHVDTVVVPGILFSSAAEKLRETCVWTRPPCPEAEGPRPGYTFALSTSASAVVENKVAVLGGWLGMVNCMYSASWTGVLKR